MSGKSHLVMGAVVLVLGVTGATIAFLGDATSLFAYLGVAAMFGFFQTCWGLGVLLWQRIRSPIRHAQMEPISDLYGVILAMAATATADGPLSDRKVNLMAHSLDMLFDLELSNEAMRRTINDLQKDETDIVGLLDSISGTIEASMKPTIIQACYMVALADGGISDKQVETLDRVATAIDLPIEEYRRTVEEIQEVIDREFGGARPATDV